MLGISRSLMATSCDDRLVSYKTSTCFARLVRDCAWTGAMPPRATSIATIGCDAQVGRCLMASEGQLRRELDKTRRQNGVRRRPCPARHERGVVGEHRARIERVVRFDSDESLCAA